VVLIRGNLEKFVSIIHNTFIAFVHNLKAATKVKYKSLCLVNYIRILSMLFLEKNLVSTLYLITNACNAATLELLIG
jgi:hypothetical protein